MEHIISLTIENKFGALSRVAGLFSGRGFNIESLSLLGLTANVLLGPLWSIWIGVVLIRQQA